MEDEESERMALIKVHQDQKLKLGDANNGCKTLAFHLEPKTVVLRVSMHCNGCAKKVEKHISKMEGVASFEVDLQSKKVVVVGDINPFEVLDSVSKRPGDQKSIPRAAWEDDEALEKKTPISYPLQHQYPPTLLEVLLEELGEEETHYVLLSLDCEMLRGKEEMGRRKEARQSVLAGEGKLAGLEGCTKGGTGKRSRVVEGAAGANRSRPGRTGTKIAWQPFDVATGQSRGVIKDSRQSTSKTLPHLHDLWNGCVIVGFERFVG
ncbi:hypothetical protein J5N97_013344 [Dioscorea zingiberensis]|uniref:HMA domain-containing protein n=1 Tax=Dioscorea zingiberensis TaxID=325984 RepID=A0A9D5CQD8_9LILI|nr:hypothetical protein J5N97_013344 [Dioscorea zingiberensis]